MTTDLCTLTTDALVEGQALCPEAQAHLSECAACAELAEALSLSIDLLQESQHSYTLAELKHLQDAVMEEITPKESIPLWRKLTEFISPLIGAPQGRMLAYGLGLLAMITPTLYFLQNPPALPEGAPSAALESEASLSSDDALDDPSLYANMVEESWHFDELETLSDETLDDLEERLNDELQ